ncbi:unnamed protein product [Scytosiphon promiscuus]
MYKLRPVSCQRGSFCEPHDRLHCILRAESSFTFRSPRRHRSALARMIMHLSVGHLFSLQWSVHS